MKVGVFGAGAIGAYIGIRLSAVDVPVTLIGRPWLEALAPRLRARGIAGDEVAAGPGLQVSVDPQDLADCDICLATVKSRHTQEAGHCLAAVLRPETPVISFQNGLRNPKRLRDAGLGRVIPGMVGFNAFLDEPEACFHQATSGPLSVGHADDPTVDGRLRRFGDRLEEAGEKFEQPDDIGAVARGKLLLNLNNAVCAAAGITIAESIQRRVHRQRLTALMAEGLAVFKALGQPVATVGRLPPALLVRLLPLPDFIVLRVAPSLIKIDPRAKSSTLQDLEAGKPTEIDDLCGEIVALGREAKVPTPENIRVVEEIRALERARGIP